MRPANGHAPVTILSLGWSAGSGQTRITTKPFSYPELRRRIEALLRRSGERVQSGLVSVGDLAIDPVSRDVRVGGRRATLSQKEFALLLALAAQPTRVFTKEELLRDVCWATGRSAAPAPWTLTRAGCGPSSRRPEATTS